MKLKFLTALLALILTTIACNSLGELTDAPEQAEPPATLPLQPEVIDAEPEPVEETSDSSEVEAAEEEAAAPEAEEVAESSEVDSSVENPANPLVDSWILNTSGEASPFIAAQVNVQSVEVRTENGVEFVFVQSSGVPNYTVQLTQEDVDELNGRPKVTSDFLGGQTSAAAGDSVLFGQDIGYTGAGCTMGYWPPGPSCPANVNHRVYFPLAPQPSAQVCETGLGTIGLWVNGSSIFNWGDSFSYNNEQVWTNLAPALEAYDADICGGHAAGDEYHQHAHPTCLGEQLQDDGSGHSPIYGFAPDGYPIYGPWFAARVLTKSAWMARDYEDPNSASGCGGGGQRICLLVDRYDLNQGTMPAPRPGPNTSEIVISLSRNEFSGTGLFFEDFYYDAALTAQGAEYLDQHNGHEHDGLGYHYHMTVAQQPDGSLNGVFPYIIGPTFYGELHGNSITSCGGQQLGGGAPAPVGGEQPADQGGAVTGGQPDLTAAAAQFGVSVEALQAALGPPPPDLAAAAQQLGVTEAVLRAALGLP